MCGAANKVLETAQNLEGGADRMDMEAWVIAQAGREWRGVG